MARLREQEKEEEKEERPLHLEHQGLKPFTIPVKNQFCIGNHLLCLKNYCLTKKKCFMQNVTAPLKRVINSMGSWIHAS